MAIPESFIDELITRCDIYDVVSRYVPLKKSGSNLFGICPFHNEKSPSFSVSRDKQFYHCFGCGAGGGAINFIMRIENLSFVEAVAFLADMVGMKLPEDTGFDDGKRARRERLTQLSADAARFFVGKMNAVGGEAARNYLKNRGFSTAILTRFGVGFAPEGWDNLINAMVEKNYTKAEMLECGLIVQNNNGGFHDRFRNRVMFPIIDLRGNVIAFGGRVMDDSMPKYLNSSDTPIFSKSRNLYAMNFAKNSKRKIFILAEGYMDVLTLYQYGFDCAVASLGTALTEEQCRLMAARGKEEVVICYDSDEAGKKAATRAIELLGKTDLRVRVLKLPGAKDPDEYIKKNGADSFEKLLVEARGDMEYRLENMKAGFDLSESDGQIGYLQLAARFLATVPSDVQREIFGRKVAKDIGVSEDAMMKEIARAAVKTKKKENAKTQSEALQPQKSMQPSARELRYTNLRSARCEEGLIALAIRDEELLKHARDNISPDEFSSLFLQKVYRSMIDRLESNVEISMASILATLSGAESDLLTKIASARVGAENPKRELDEYIDVIKTENNTDSDEDFFGAAIKRLEKNSHGGN